MRKSTWELVSRVSTDAPAVLRAQLNGQKTEAAVEESFEGTVWIKPVKISAQNRLGSI